MPYSPSGGMRSDGLSAGAWANEPGEKPWSTEATKSNQDASGIDDGGWAASTTPSKTTSPGQKQADPEQDSWGHPTKAADPEDWGNATAGADGDWGSINSPHSAPQDETPQKELKTRGGGRGSGGGKRGRRGEESDSRGGRGGARGGRGRGDGRGRGMKVVSDAPPKLPEIPVSSTEEVDWAKAAGGA